MKIKGITDECFSDYKKISMYVAFPKCTFKCDKDCGRQVCQNSPLDKSPNLEVNADDIVDRYINNDITKAIVFGGLDPFDTVDSMLELVGAFRKKTEDDIVIYTGYTKEEVSNVVEEILVNVSNIIIKYGRFVPDVEGRFDEVLGIELASKNQFAEKVSKN